MGTSLSSLALQLERRETLLSSLSLPLFSLSLSLSLSSWEHCSPAGETMREREDNESLIQLDVVKERDTGREDRKDREPLSLIFSSLPTAQCRRERERGEWR